MKIKGKMDLQKHHKIYDLASWNCGEGQRKGGGLGATSSALTQIPPLDHGLTA